VIKEIEEAIVKISGQRGTACGIQVLAEFFPVFLKFSGEAFFFAPGIRYVPFGIFQLLFESRFRNSPINCVKKNHPVCFADVSVNKSDYA